MSNGSIEQLIFSILNHSQNICSCLYPSSEYIKLNFSTLDILAFSSWWLFIYLFKFFKISFWLERDCYKILCWLLPYESVNQPQVHICPHLPLPSTPSSPSRSSQSTRLSSLCPHSSFTQAIYFTHGNIYLPMQLFQFVPPAPSSAVSKICSLFLHLYSCSAYRFIRTIFLDSVLLIHNLPHLPHLPILPSVLLNH